MLQAMLLQINHQEFRWVGPYLSGSRNCSAAFASGWKCDASLSTRPLSRTILFAEPLAASSCVRGRTAAHSVTAAPRLSTGAASGSPCSTT